MQSFEGLTSNGGPGNGHCADASGAERCARLLMETMPVVFMAVRGAIAGKQGQLTRGKNSTVSFPQYRTLVFLSGHHGAGLSELAEFLGLSLPSASKQVDLLVKQGLLARQHDVEDRRRITLQVTRRGQTLYKNARERIRLHLAESLGRCDDEALRSIVEGLTVLQAQFPFSRPFLGPNGESSQEAGGGSIIRNHLLETRNAS